MHDAKGYMPSLGGIETPGSFGLTRAPSMIVPECVQTASNMACVSAREEMGHGPTQTGDVGRVMDGVISETAPAPRDAACEVHSVFCEWPKRVCLHDREPTLKRSVLGTRHQHGRLKWRRIGSSEFGKHMFPCEHVCGARCAARRECCSRSARSESRWRHSRARVRGKPRGAVRVRVTSWAGIAQHEGQVSNARWLTWGMARKRACGAVNGATLRSYVLAKQRGRACCKPPPW